VGLGYLSLSSDVDDRTRDITYARFNYLPKRWNMEAAQANVFVSSQAASCCGMHAGCRVPQSRVLPEAA